MYKYWKIWHQPNMYSPLWCQTWVGTSILGQTWVRQDLLRHNMRINAPNSKQLHTKPWSTHWYNVLWPSMMWLTIKKKMRRIEMKQRRAARYVWHQYRNRLSITRMFEELGWQSLAESRELQRLVMMYNMNHNLRAIRKEEYITLLIRSADNTHPQG